MATGGATADRKLACFARGAGGVYCLWVLTRSYYNRLPCVTGSRGRLLLFACAYRVDRSAVRLFRRCWPRRPMSTRAKEADQE